MKGETIFSHVKKNIELRHNLNVLSFMFAAKIIHTYIYIMYPIFISKFFTPNEMKKDREEEENEKNYLHSNYDGCINCHRK
jgi:hypothetical protein